MAAEATRTTMTVIALALFGGDPRLISEDSMRHIAAAIEGFSEARMLALLRLPQIPGDAARGAPGNVARSISGRRWPRSSPTVGAAG